MIALRVVCLAADYLTEKPPLGQFRHTEVQVTWELPDGRLSIETVCTGRFSDGVLAPTLARLQDLRESGDAI